jgi:hypothetical protein
METMVEIPPNAVAIKADAVAIKADAGANGAKPRRRSRARQGKTRLLTLQSLDGRTAAFQVARQLIDTLSGDLGGDDHLTTGQRQLVMRAAMCGAIVADFEARWVGGEHVPLAEYLSAVNVQRRVLATLGLERRQKDVGPTLDRYLERLALEKQERQREASSAESLARDKECEVAE